MNSNHCKILLVEDSESIRSTLKLALELEGYQIQEATDGVEALKILTNSPAPDLILLDMLMPNMNGWEFVEEIKKDSQSPLSKIPIVAVTATSEKVQRIPKQIENVIKKPVQLDQLYQVVRRYCPHED